MPKKIDYRKELAAAREAVRDLPRSGNEETIEAYWEVCCGDVLLAEHNRSEQKGIWENASLAKEFLGIAEYLEGYDHMLDNLKAATERMVDTITDHPSLTLKLLYFLSGVIRRIEAQCGHDLSAAEDVMADIRFYEKNIDRADSGLLDEIEQTGILKQDPVEWTAGYEANIDEVERLVEEELEDVPRGMGFCFSYWMAKERILMEKFGIRWRSPAEMNPGVLFD